MKTKHAEWWVILTDYRSADFKQLVWFMHLKNAHKRKIYVCLRNYILAKTGNGLDRNSLEQRGLLEKRAEWKGYSVLTSSWRKTNMQDETCKVMILNINRKLHCGCQNVSINTCATVLKHVPWNRVQNKQERGLFTISKHKTLQWAAT